MLRNRWEADQLVLSCMVLGGMLMLFALWMFGW